MNKGMELPYTCFDQGVRLKSSFAFFSHDQPIVTASLFFIDIIYYFYNTLNFLLYLYLYFPSCSLLPSHLMSPAPLS